jgi:chorismate mutase
MPEELSHEQKGQIERAQRIRQQIERLKSGRSEEDRPDTDKSLREQVEERSKQSKNPA